MSDGWSRPDINERCLIFLHTRVILDLSKQKDKGITLVEHDRFDYRC